MTRNVVAFNNILVPFLVPRDFDSFMLSTTQ